MSAYVAADVDAVGEYLEGWSRQAISSVRGLLETESASPEHYEVAIADRPPVPAIRHAVEDYQPDLLIMGTRGGGRVQRALLGGVANRVMQEVACDALIVPEGSCAAPRKAFQRHTTPIEQHANPSGTTRSL
jgi:nucleotide-binding universal stress UspA family protein